MKLLIIYYTTFLLTLGCSESPKAVDKIIIKRVSPELDTFFKIGCDNFESAFGSEIVEVEVIDRDKLDYFSKRLALLKHDKEKYYPDVRSKVLIIFSDGSNETLCISHLGIIYNEQPMVLDQELYDFIFGTNK
jgi:hypothetical protein